MTGKVLPAWKCFVVLPGNKLNHNIFATKKKIMYHSKKKHLVSVLSFILMLFLVVPLKANPGGFTDDELKGFANAVVQVISIQQQGQAQMISKIEEEDMTVQRFNEINMQAQEMPLEQIDMTEKEAESFVMLLGEIEQIQIDLEEVLISTIEDSGISLEKYEEIMTEYQQNPELQQRVQELMR